MQTEQRPMSSKSAQKHGLPGLQETPLLTTESGENTGNRIPARLPSHSRAAAAQRLNDVPEHIPRGVYYEVLHQPLNPNGWRTKRHLKRKNLRFTNEQVASIDRLSIRTMLTILCGALIFCVIVASGGISLFSLMQATQQQYGQQVVTLESILPRDNLRMYDEHGTLIYQMIDQGRQISVPLDEISPYLAHAEIAIEDQYFWSNPGYDITGIVRAMIDDLTQGRVVSGGSTITQQLIKNGIVGNQTTAVRKLQEIILAPAVTRYYTKQKLLEMYLNTSYYGEQAYGAEAAAAAYYGLQDTPTNTAASQLDLAQAAMLAGIPSSPVARDPKLHPQAAMARMKEVLNQMVVQGYITPLQQQQAISEAQRPGFFKSSKIDNSLAPHFASFALNELAHDMHVKVSDLSRSGLIVSTTLDLPFQNKVLKDAQRHIAELAKKHNMSNAAVVMIDYHTGAIRTLLGNIDPNNPKDGAFDVASQGYRQPGSTFKAFIYATAFEKGISPGAPVFDGPLTIQMCCGLPSYTPLNYDRQYHGLLPYRRALQNSFNIPAVKLLLQLGVPAALHTAQVMGIKDYEGTPNYTMVLGSLSVHLTDMTSAYGIFANGGVLVPYHAIESVKYVPTGRIIYQAPVTGKRVLSKQVSYMMTDVLSDNTSRTFEFGACSALYLFSNSTQQCYAGHPGAIRPAAVKTGTSNDFRDNWTIGYTTDYVVGVWAGNNDNSAMVDITGVDGAAPI
ncbi:MAG TPA: transglycosylase domain-containing protein, partial [Ktedonobacteraceae bacterium]